MVVVQKITKGWIKLQTAYNLVQPTRWKMYFKCPKSNLWDRKEQFSEGIITGLCIITAPSFAQYGLQVHAVPEDRNASL